MNPTSPEASRVGFAGSRWSAIGTCAVVGLLLGAMLAALAPASYRSTVSVLITRLAIDELDTDAESQIESQEPIETEIRFVNSALVRNAVRASIPTAPDTVDVALASAGNVLEITTSADTIDEAQRLARNWATAFIDQRQNALMQTWQDRTTFSAAVLEDLITEIGEARLALDDTEVERLEARRNLAAAEEAKAALRLEELRSSPGAEMFADASRPTSRSGAPFLPAALGGLVFGSLVGFVWSWSQDRRAQNDDEARSWLDKVNEGTLEPARTVRGLDIPAFLDPGVPPLDVAAPAAVVPAAGLPAVAPEPTAAAASEPIIEEPLPQQRSPTPLANRQRVAQRQEKRSIAPTQTSSVVRQPSLSEPIRIVRLATGAKPTRAPRRSVTDEAWADDFTLVTDA